MFYCYFNNLNTKRDGSDLPEYELPKAIFIGRDRPLLGTKTIKAFGY